MPKQNNIIPPDESQSKFFTGNLITFSTDLPPSQIRGNHRSHFRTYRLHYNNFQEQGIVALHNALLKNNFNFHLKKQLLLILFIIIDCWIWTILDMA